MQNPKYGHKLDFIAETRAWFAARTGFARTVLVGDLNIAPLEHDVWSHKQLLDVVSHTPPETEGLRRLAEHRLRRRRPPFRSGSTKSCSPGGRTATATGGCQTAADGSTTSGSPRTCRERYASRLVLRDARDWERGSDHVPVCVEMRGMIN